MRFLHTLKSTLQVFPWRIISNKESSRKGIVAMENDGQWNSSLRTKSGSNPNTSSHPQVEQNHKVSDYYLCSSTSELK